MKNIQFLIVFLGLFLLINCQEEKKKEPKAKSKIYYTCSMDLQVKEDKPGSCPICHMELTPMKDDNSAIDEIALSEQQIHLGNINSIVIDESKNVVKDKFTGVLSLDQEKIYTLSSRTNGRIDRLYNKTIGDFISKNNPIYEIYSEELAIAKQDYLSAYKQQDIPGDFGKNAKNIALAAKQKLVYYGLSENQINQIVNTKKLNPNTTFYSSYNGYISEIMTTEGSFVMEGTPLIQISDLSTLWLETQINVNYINKIKIGQKTKLTFLDFPNNSIEGKISFINPEINPNSRLLLVRIAVPNKKLLLKPGMQGMIELSQSDLKGLFIPVDAIIREQNAAYVWIEKEKGLYKNVMVTIGAETNGLIEIKSGIKKGDIVVISGAYAINSEYRFRKGVNPMEGHDMDKM